MERDRIGLKKYKKVRRSRLAIYSFELKIPGLNGQVPA